MPDYPFDGGSGGRYRVLVTTSKSVEVELPKGVTWSGYIKAVLAAAGGEQWKLVQSHRLDGQDMNRCDSATKASDKRAERAVHDGLSDGSPSTEPDPIVAESDRGSRG